MITHCLNLFRTFYGVHAEIKGDETLGELTLVSGQNIQSFRSEQELIQFLVCRTLHLNFINHKLPNFKAFNLAMIELNMACDTENLVFAEQPNGVVKLWCRDSEGWFVVCEYYDLPAMYSHILSTEGKLSIKEKVKRKTSFLGRISRAFKKK